MWWVWSVLISQHIFLDQPTSISVAKTCRPTTRDVSAYSRSVYELKHPSCIGTVWTNKNTMFVLHRINETLQLRAVIRPHGPQHNELKHFWSWYHQHFQEDLYGNTLVDDRDRFTWQSFLD